MIDDTELGKWKWSLEKPNITEYLAPAKKMYYLEYGGKAVRKSKRIQTSYMVKKDYEDLLKFNFIKKNFPESGSLLVLSIC